MIRNPIFDMMKGIAIIAVVVGHCPVGSIVTNFIFTWHIPLFFVISGYFYKPQPLRDFFIKNFRQLIIPYLLTCLAMIVLAGIKMYVTGKGLGIINTAIATLIGNGTINNPMFSQYSIGAIWFLPALFWCRLIFNYLYTNFLTWQTIGAVLVLSTLATFVGSFFFIPTALLQGLQAMLFYGIGNILYKQRAFEWHIGFMQIVIILGLILLSMYAGGLSMVRCYYGNWPINHIAAIGAVLFLYQICKFMKNCRWVAFWGRVSMLVLAIHNIEYTFLPLDYVHSFILVSPKVTDLFSHLFTTLLLTWFAVHIKCICVIFGINREVLFEKSNTGQIK